ncbi:MAG: hypothetical protein V3T17_05640 [Pseudomonadales bacterium]
MWQTSREVDQCDRVTGTRCNTGISCPTPLRIRLACFSGKQLDHACSMVAQRLDAIDQRYNGPIAIPRKKCRRGEYVKCLDMPSPSYQTMSQLICMTIPDDVGIRIIVKEIGDIHGLV